VPRARLVSPDSLNLANFKGLPEQAAPELARQRKEAGGGERRDGGRRGGRRRAHQARHQRPQQRGAAANKPAGVHPMSAGA
jgi:hypothetical protein